VNGYILQDVAAVHSIGLLYIVCFVHCFNTRVIVYGNHKCSFLSAVVPAIILLLLACYVPNVAKRSIWEQCKKYILRTDRRPATSDQRPTTVRPLIWPILEKFQMAISSRGVVRSTSYLVLRWGFRGRRIEWRDFRFRQIQDGGPAAILENSNGDISAAVIQFTPFLVLGWGFRRRRIEWR